MTLLTYQVFKTVADIGSFRKAADILGLTPSAISHKDRCLFQRLYQLAATDHELLRKKISGGRDRGISGFI